jgi:hypothetical protein
MCGAHTLPPRSRTTSACRWAAGFSLLLPGIAFLLSMPFFVAAVVLLAHEE